MASHYHAYHADKKVTAGTPKKLPSPGSTQAMPEKAGPFPGLPGKAQGKNRSMGVKKVKIYNRSEGL